MRKFNEAVFNRMIPKIEKFGDVNIADYKFYGNALLAVAAICVSVAPIIGCTWKYFNHTS